MVEREREREGFPILMFGGNCLFIRVNFEWNYIVFTLQACHNFYEQREKVAPKWEGDVGWWAVVLAWEL